MFERFTPEAEHVVAVAQTEARETGHDETRAEHLVLAVLTGDGVGRRVLEKLGVEVQRVRAAVLALATDDGDAGALATIGVDLPEVRRAPIGAEHGVGAARRAARRRARRAHACRARVAGHTSPDEHTAPRTRRRRVVGVSGS